MRWLRTPLLHFLVGGTLLFAVVRLARSPSGEAADRPVVITAADIVTMRNAYTRETGLQPTAADEAALVERALDEELLFREALARGLDRDPSVRAWLVEQMRVLSDDLRSDDESLYTRAVALGLDHKDLVVRRILVQKMRLLAARAGEADVSDARLRAYYDRHRDAYRSPARVSLWHVYLAPTRAADAVTLASRWRDSGVPAAELARRGDPFPRPPHLVSQSRQQLATLFGATVADQILTAAEGTWVGPLPSALGVHLVWIEAREPEAAPAFEAVRGRVLEAWRQEHRAQRLAELLRMLRQRQPLQVESSAWHERTRS